MYFVFRIAFHPVSRVIGNEAKSTFRLSWDVRTINDDYPRPYPAWSTVAASKVAVSDYDPCS